MPHPTLIVGRITENRLMTPRIITFFALMTLVFAWLALGFFYSIQDANANIAAIHANQALTETAIPFHIEGPLVSRGGETRRQANQPAWMTPGESYCWVLSNKDLPLVINIKQGRVHIIKTSPEPPKDLGIHSGPTDLFGGRYKFFSLDGEQPIFITVAGAKEITAIDWGWRPT